MARTDTSGTLRAAEILTTSYVASTPIPVVSDDRQNLYIAFTLGSLTSAEMVVEFSPNGADWYQQPTLAAVDGVITVSPAVHTFTAEKWGTGANKTRIGVELHDNYLRIKAKGTGTVTGSSFEVTSSEA